MKRHIKAQKRLHRIAFEIYQDVVTQLNPIPGKYRKELDVLYRVLTQKKDDTNKVYSVHEPEVLCISKGKEHKQY
ncbi:MAG: IS5/IS1182 family transposase, partial [Bacteroidetes bacterium]